MESVHRLAPVLWLAMASCQARVGGPAELDAASSAEAGGALAEGADGAAMIPAAPPALASPGDAGPDGALADGALPACAGVFCDDFEAPAGASLSGSWSSTAPQCSGDGQVRFDATLAHSGRRSLRVQSGGGYCNHVFAQPALTAEQLTGELWLRFYVRFQAALGDGHVTFARVHDRLRDKDLRLGAQVGVWIWNRELDDATLPELSPAGVSMSLAPTPQRWHCLEVHLDGAHGRLETFHDGAPLPGLVVDATPTADVDGQWLRGAGGAWQVAPSELGFGWESYGGQPMTLWFDDVAIGPQRFGCP